MQVANRHFDFLFGCFVFGPVSLAFQKISLGFGSFVFHYWWDGLFVPAATWGFAMAFRRICANRGWVDCFG